MPLTIYYYCNFREKIPSRFALIGSREKRGGSNTLRQFPESEGPQLQIFCPPIKTVAIHIDRDCCNNMSRVYTELVLLMSTYCTLIEAGHFG